MQQSKLITCKMKCQNTFACA